MPVCVVYYNNKNNNMFIELKTRRGYAHIVYTQYCRRRRRRTRRLGPSDKNIGIDNTEKSIWSA